MGSGLHAKQTADIMTRREPVHVERKPDMVLVRGEVEVNSGDCAGLREAGVTRRGPVAAGLQSFDRTKQLRIRFVPGCSN
jgi:UDP-N-acetylglucosamine 2-epimerase (non-hydrolysing)